MRDKSYDDFMIEHYRANPDYAASLVNSIIEDGDDQGELIFILKDIVTAGLKVSFTSVAPEQKPRKRTKTVTAKAAKHHLGTEKATKRLPRKNRERHLEPVRVGIVR